MQLFGRAYIWKQVDLEQLSQPVDDQWLPNKCAAIWLCQVPAIACAEFVILGVTGYRIFQLPSVLAIACLASRLDC